MVLRLVVYRSAARRLQGALVFARLGEWTKVKEVISWEFCICSLERVLSSPSGHDRVHARVTRAELALMQTLVELEPFGAPRGPLEKGFKALVGWASMAVG